jgi:dipeptidyl aminopeptidase/acylaminoacyl peptidase
MSQKRPFEIEDLFRFQFISEAQLSPDGERVVYSLLRLDEKKDIQCSELWLLDLQSGKAKPLTAGDWNDFSPAWSPDGEEIAFLSTRSGAPQIYLICPNGGEARRRTNLGRGCQGPLLWSPDGNWIAFHGSPSEPVNPDGPYRIRRKIYRFDGAGLVDNMIRQVYVLPCQGGEPLQLTHEESLLTANSWSPDGRKILVSLRLDPKSLDNFASASLLSVTLDGEVRILQSGKFRQTSNAAWLPDGRILFSGVENSRPIGTKVDLWIMDADGQGIACRSASLPNGVGGQLHDDLPIYWNMSPTPLLASEDGSEVITTIQSGGSVNVFSLTTCGPEKAVCLLQGERTCFPLDRRGGRLLFGVSTLFDPTQLAVYQIESQEECTLTQLNKPLLERIELPLVENLHFKGTDGADVEGWIMKPKGESPYPTVLHIHGGPHVGYGNCFYFDFLSLCGAGYAVLFINHRGSSGYGNEFATAIIGDWGNLDYGDLMAGVDAAIEKGIADPERLGCCGVSGGGNLSCWIVGHTDRFKAAVPENPVTNWFSHYGTADVGPEFDRMEMGGKPHEIPEVYLRCSPIFYAHKCKTPTLLVQGEDDYRCPAGQSEEFFAVLKANGCTAEMVRFPGSSHGGATYGSLAVRRMHNEVLLEWMNRYVKGSSPDLA